MVDTVSSDWTIYCDQAQAESEREGEREDQQACDNATCKKRSILIITQQDQPVMRLQLTQANRVILELS